MVPDRKDTLNVSRAFLGAPYILIVTLAGDTPKVSRAFYHLVFSGRSGVL
jgi:hypothetical protein